MIAAASSHVAVPVPELDDASVDRLAATVISVVSASRSTWRAHHVRAEAERQLRYADRPGDRQAVEQIVAAALDGHSVAVARQVDAECGEPEVLRRRDGSSVYTRHGQTVYSSAAVLAAERRILAAADFGGGRIAEEADVSLALLEAEANGRPLNDGQRALVGRWHRRGAGSTRGRPAGTGKTTATAALAAAWPNSGGTISLGWRPPPRRLKCSLESSARPPTPSPNSSNSPAPIRTGREASMIRHGSGSTPSTSPRWS